MSEILLDRDLNECLRAELSWKDVAQGLTRILTGYAIWIFGNMLGIALILAPLLEVGFKVRTARLGIGQLWMFYAGMGILSITGIFSCGMIVGGKWKCVLNASERNGCRWLMFLCLACMAMSVALSLLSSVAGLKVQPEFKLGVAGLWQVRYTTAGIVFNLISLALGMVYTGMFALFLRSVAQCMDSRWHIRMVDLFLSILVPLALATGYLAYKHLTGDQPMVKPLLFVGAGWIVCFLFWLTMIAMVRSCILNTVERVRDPLVYSGANLVRKPSFS